MTLGIAAQVLLPLICPSRVLNECGRCATRLVLILKSLTRQIFPCIRHSQRPLRVYINVLMKHAPTRYEFLPVLHSARQMRSVWREYSECIAVPLELEC